MRKARRGRRPPEFRASRRCRTARNMLDSVRVRLTVWYSAVLAGVLILVSTTTYFIVRKTSMQRTDSDMQTLADSFLVTFHAELEDAGSTQASAVLSAADQSIIEHRSINDAFVIFEKDGQIIANSNDIASAGVKPRPVAAAAIASTEFHQFATRNDGEPTRVDTIRGGRAQFRAYARHFNAVGQDYVLVVLHSLHAQNEMLETIRLAFTWMILVGLILAGTGGYFLARKSLAPVVAMGAHAQRIGAANLHDRLPVLNANDELGKLATIFNDLLDRLDQSFERQ